MAGRTAAINTFDAGGRKVTCRNCSRTYICTPEDDYYNADSATSGVCLDCLVAKAGLDPKTVEVIYLNDPQEEQQ